MGLRELPHAFDHKYVLKAHVSLSLKKPDHLTFSVTLANDVKCGRDLSLYP